MDSNIARILTNTNASGKKIASRASDNIVFQRDVIDSLNGPALIIDESSEIIHKNIYADNLVAGLEDKNPTIQGLVIRCLTNCCPENQKLSIDDESGTRHYDLFAFPINSNEKNKFQVLLFGKDTTVEQHLTKALVDSRQMFKDLVSCSTDFAWETDNKGRFKYVSPNGILGYTAYELNDKRAADLIVGQGGLNPFDTLDAINDVEIWLQRSDSTFACVQVSANPIIDNNSRWQGARGVCRDITEIREREASLRHVRKNEQVLKKIISTIRDELDPSKILETTALAALDGINAANCYIMAISNIDDEIQVELKSEAGKHENTDVLKILREKALAYCDQSDKSPPPSYIEDTINEQSTLIGFSKHHNEINGVMFVFSNDLDKSWDRNDKSLFVGITSHLGVALEQIKNYEKLEKLSNTDELTSLFNRRAFTEMVNKRLIIQKRQQQTCALLFIDLDNFKQVNDVYGHAVGDKVLKKLSQALIKNTRAEDFCCRLGGDEFAIWLESIEEDSAVYQAKRILESVNDLKQIAKNEDQPLSLSIGVALSPPDASLSLDDLMELADKALYDVKQNGKSAVLLNQSKVS